MSTRDIAAGAITIAWRRRSRAHPDPLPVAPASDRGVWGPLGTRDGDTVARLVKRALPDRGTPWPSLPATVYLRYVRDGDRIDYEQRVAARSVRLSQAAVAAAETLEPAWIDEVIDGVITLCEQSTWCWPAHDDAPSRGGALPDAARPFLDLGAGEVVAQLAWVDHLLGAQLDERAPGLRGRVRHEARQRVFEPFMQRRDWHWLGLHDDVHNWSPWIQGNVLLAAIALLDEDRDAVVDLALRGLDIYAEALPEDGAIDEGASYWWNGACRALEAVALLGEVWGPLDLDAPQGLRATLDFPRLMHLGGDWFVSVADSTARQPSSLPWHAAFRVSRAHDARAAARFAHSRRVPGEPVAQEHEGLGRLLLALTDAAWSAPADAPEPSPPDIWLPSVELGIARAADEPGHGLAVVLKGGHNAENHNHLDVGSFIVAADGVPFLVDPGRPTYTRQTFSPERYEIWTMRSDWHSVPAIGGAEQALGRDHGARDPHVEVSERSTSFSIDLDGAYDLTSDTRWRRTVRLDRDAATAVIEDAWTGRTSRPTAWRALIAGDVDATAGAATVTTLEGRTVQLSWNPDLAARWDVRTLDDPILADIWGARITRLTLDVATDEAGQGIFTLQAQGR